VIHTYFAADSWFVRHWNDVGTIASIVIAFVAAFRPELHAFLRPRKVDVILADSYFLEIGFDTFGPTVGMVGTLNNEHARSVITKLRVHLELPDDGGEFVLSPVYDRVREIGTAYAGGEDTRLKVWLPFLVEDDVAVSFDVLFRNDAVNIALTSIGYDLGKAWAIYANQNADANATAIKDPDEGKQKANLAEFLIGLYNSSLNQPFLQQARTAVANTFVWRAGLYKARLEVAVLNSRRVFSRDFVFSLSDEQCQQLFGNVDRLVAVICQLNPSTPMQSTISKITI
jgi:hypothetical protein